MEPNKEKCYIELDGSKDIAQCLLDLALQYNPHLADCLGECVPIVPPAGSTTDPSVDLTVDPDPAIDPTVEPCTDPAVDPTDASCTDSATDPTIEPTTEPIDSTVDPVVDPATCSDIRSCLLLLAKKLNIDLASRLQTCADAIPCPDEQTGITEPTVDPTVEPTNETTTDPVTEPSEKPDIRDCIKMLANKLNPQLAVCLEACDEEVPTTDPAVDPTVECSDPTVDPTIDCTDPVVDPTVDTTEPAVDPTVDCTDPAVDPTVNTACSTVDSRGADSSYAKNIRKCLYIIAQKINPELAECFMNAGGCDITEPTTDPITEPTDPETVDPTTDPITEPVTEPTGETVTDQGCDDLTMSLMNIIRALNPHMAVCVDEYLAGGAQVLPPVKPIKPSKSISRKPSRRPIRHGTGYPNYHRGLIDPSMRPEIMPIEPEIHEFQLEIPEAVQSTDPSRGHMAKPHAMPMRPTTVATHSQRPTGRHPMNAGVPGEMPGKTVRSGLKPRQPPQQSTNPIKPVKPQFRACLLQLIKQVDPALAGCLEECNDLQ